MSDDITLSVNNITYGGWESLDVTISMETLAGVFNISMSDTTVSNLSQNLPAKTPTIIPGLPATLKINNNTLITGYVDKVSPQLSATTHTIIVQGRDKTGDLVDCSMIQPINQWTNLSLEQIIARICQPFGIPVSINVDSGAILDYFVIEQGATCLEALQKLCYMRQCLAISDGKGGLLITRAATDITTTNLIEGQNILSINADYDFSQRYNIYLCKGQKQGDDNIAPTTVALTAEEVDDPGINRYRPFLILFDGQATSQDCKNRATWEAALRRGKSIKITVTVAGWTQSDGSLWGINKIVFVNSPSMGINGNLLISVVNFKLDENGELTVLTLTSPEAYTIEKPQILKGNPYLT